VVGAGLWLAAAVTLLAGCAQLPEHRELAPAFAQPLADDGALDRILAPVEAAHAAQSGFRLVIEGMEAFALRAHSAHLAARSLDVQTYIWHADTTGLYLARQLLAAADRGVQVRLLVDDLDARAHNDGYAALAAHPNIEVRLFNPFATRSGGLRLAGEGARDFGRINRRMHNKSWIADNRVALVGGRNLGDEYFSASDETNFVDLDFVMVGPVVREVSASFDRFWNSPSSWPIELLDATAVADVALARARDRLAAHAAAAQAGRYALALRDNDGIRRLAAGEWALQWSSSYRFVSDDPAKVTMKKRDAARAAVATAIAPLVREARESVQIISPYFVPGAQGTAGLVARAKAGRRVEILTNSLAANDVSAVHGGYSRHRKALLAGGVALWELKPTSKPPGDSSIAGSSGASLHTKALTADGFVSFVGSYNLDPRSTWLNSEQGVLVEHPGLAGQVADLFRLQTGGGRAWRVTLVDHELRWSDGHTVRAKEPETTMAQRFQAWLARVFRLDAQL
jgi:putative cardiolipin synthase